MWDVFCYRGSVSLPDICLSCGEWCTELKTMLVSEAWSFFKNNKNTIYISFGLQQKFPILGSFTPTLHRCQRLTKVQGSREPGSLVCIHLIFRVLNVEAIFAVLGGPFMVKLSSINPDGAPSRMMSRIHSTSWNQGELQSSANVRSWPLLFSVFCYVSRLCPWKIINPFLKDGLMV